MKLFSCALGFALLATACAAGSTPGLTTGTGGEAASGAAGPVAGTGGTGGTGGAPMIPCTVPTDCPGVDDECQSRTCVGGFCGTGFTPEGTAVAAQTVADCKKNQC